MSLTRVSFTIDDNQWPKLHMAGSREGTQGAKTAFELKAQYDLAYSQFENLLHNQLRPLVDELIRRRKDQQ